jgi:hypothetical protein
MIRVSLLKIGLLAEAPTDWNSVGASTFCVRYTEFYTGAVNTLASRLTSSGTIVLISSLKTP